MAKYLSPEWHAVAKDLAQTFPERAGARHRREVGGNDVLGGTRPAPQMAFRLKVQAFERHLAEDVAEVQLGLDDAVHVPAAHLARVALVALGHCSVPGLPRHEGERATRHIPVGLCRFRI